MVIHCRSGCLLWILASVAVAAAEIPAGTALSVRQQGTVGTRFSKVGDPISAVLLAPVLDHDRTILPAGSELAGRVTMVQAMGLGFKHRSASLALDFDTLRLADGTEVPIDARLKRVETAREWVDPDGRIHGIGPVAVSASLAVNAWRVMISAPVLGTSILAVKLVFAPAPDTEIAFAQGTEYRLELVRPLTIEDRNVSSLGRPTDLLSRELRIETRATMEALPSQRVKRVSGAPADLVNLVLVGSAGGVTRAFQAAGWSTSDRKAAGSIMRSYFSIALRQGYQNAPMATMMLDGNRSDIALEKSLDTFARRHHVRVWWRTLNEEGESVWVAAATEDTGITFSAREGSFTHVIDGDVDAERTKVADDLLYTGCVSEAGLLERHNLPANLKNGTGTKLRTDGRVAVLRINGCEQPRVMPGASPPEKTSVARSLASALRSELIRSNFISIAYNGVRLTSATRKFLFGGPPHDGTGAALTRQQVAWLGATRPEIQAPAVAHAAVR
jgi:hypothetical protein